jgi:hypothetical protein
MLQVSESLSKPKHSLVRFMITVQARGGFGKLSVASKATIVVWHSCVTSQRCIVSSNAVSMVGKLVGVWKLMLDPRYTACYRVSVAFKAEGHKAPTVGFWCMDPRVVFEGIASTCRSVILSSGASHGVMGVQHCGRPGASSLLVGHASVF